MAEVHNSGILLESGTNEIEIMEFTIDGNLYDTPLYTPSGVQVDYSYKGIVIKNGKKFFQK